MKQKQPRDYTGVLSSIFAIVLGLIVGLIILFLCNPAQALPGFATILTGAFTHGAKGVGQVFYYATPIILTGLSVGFAFKTGLFNIGTPGQFIMGGFGAVYVGILWTSLGPAHWFVALLASVVMGAVWGLVPGLLKAYYNVNEVIASIMMNYIGMYLVNWIVKSSKPLFNNLRNESRNVAATANIPKMGLDKIFPGSSVNGGIIIAIIVVILIYLLLNKTTFGYELKACGFNKDAAKYAGINEKRNIVLSMTISGALAGIGAGLYYLSGASEWNPQVSTALPAIGFNGIPVALLALSNPIGVVFAAIFVAHISVGGAYLPTKYYQPEIADLIVAVIIYLCAFVMLFKSVVVSKLSRKKAKKEDVK